MSRNEILGMVTATQNWLEKQIGQNPTKYLRQFYCPEKHNS